MDIFHDILDTLDLKGTLYFRTCFMSPWAVQVPKFEQVARFHLVVQGQCFVNFPSGEQLKLNAGDMILIPAGAKHIISDGHHRNAAPLETVLSTSGYDGKGVLVIGKGDPDATTQLICGHYNFRKGADHPVLRALPEFLVVSTAMRASHPWLDDMLRLIVRRLFSGDKAADAVVTRLSESIFIELVNAGIENNQLLKDLMRGFNDRHIGSALELIHERPDHPWTVESLAREVGMSRSRFAEKFQHLVGSGPMAYLSEWRIQKALSLLNSSHWSVQQIAKKTGYRSPAAFTRAFSLKMGFPPSQYRQSYA